MDGPFDPFSYAWLAPLADKLWAVTWAEEGKRPLLSGGIYAAAAVS